MEIILRDEARKYIERLDVPTRRRIKNALLGISGGFSKRRY